MTSMLPAAARKNVYSIPTGIDEMVGKIFHLPIDWLFLDIIGNCFVKIAFCNFHLLFSQVFLCFTASILIDRKDSFLVCNITKLS